MESRISQGLFSGAVNAYVDPEKKHLRKIRTKLFGSYNKAVQAAAFLNEFYEKIYILKNKTESKGVWSFSVDETKEHLDSLKKFESDLRLCLEYGLRQHKDMVYFLEKLCVYIVEAKEIIANINDPLESKKEIFSKLLPNFLDEFKIKFGNAFKEIQQEVIAVFFDNLRP